MRLTLVIFNFVERLVNRHLRSFSVASQYPNLKLGLVAIIRAPKRYAAKALSSRHAQIQVLSKLHRNLRMLQGGKDHLELNLVAAFPHASHGLPVGFLLRPNESDVAIAALRKAISKFGFAERTEHRVTPAERLQQFL